MAKTPVSIVMLTYNKLDFTRQCIENLMRNTTKYQLIVVDNASSDDTPAYLTQLARSNKHVRVLLNERNRGFAGGCNQGVEAARHEFVCLLNNDTIPLPGWLDPLRDTMAAGIGVVGSKLLWPNLRIQHAGIDFVTTPSAPTVFVPVHRGIHATWDEPHADVPYAVAGVTAACMLTTKSVWRAVGGMDEGFGIGNYEDVDFVLKVREMGLLAIYRPESRLIHYEHVSFEGLDNRALLAENFEKLSERWNQKLMFGLASA